MTNNQRFMIILKTALLFPMYCMIYYFTPTSKIGQLLRRPFMKFLMHASSYVFFLREFYFLLMTSRPLLYLLQQVIKVTSCLNKKKKKL